MTVTNDRLHDSENLKKIDFLKRKVLILNLGQKNS